jgi:hypothetical protein
MSQNNLLSKIIFEYAPKELEKELPQEFYDLKIEILKSLGEGHIAEQHYITIDNIIINLEKNNHLGHDTYKCKIVLSSQTPGADFVHVEEGKDYIHNIRESINALKRFILKKKGEFEKAEKNGSNKEF